MKRKKTFLGVLTMVLAAGGMSFGAASAQGATEVDPETESMQGLLAQPSIEARYGSERSAADLLVFDTPTAGFPDWGQTSPDGTFAGRSLADVEGGLVVVPEAVATLEITSDRPTLTVLEANAAGELREIGYTTAGRTAIPVNAGVTYVVVGDGNVEYALNAPPRCGGLPATHVQMGGSVSYGAGNQVVVGSDQAESMELGPGDDVACGFGNEDFIEGGDGEDIIYGGTVEGCLFFDQLYGDGGDDILFAASIIYTGDRCGEARAFVNGGDDDDVIFGAPTNASMQGNDGNDTLYGQGFGDSVSGGAGNDTLFGGEGRDSVTGGTGDDKIYGGPEGDDLRGNAGKDRIEGQAGNDVLVGGGANDVMFGGTGDDDLDAGPGDDLLFGQGGNDLLLGQDGNDRLYGWAGDDELDGGVGDDLLFGHGGNDVLRGDEGNDRLWGWTGDDQLFGGVGDDELLGQGDDDALDGGDGVDLVYGAQGNDTLIGGPGLADQCNGGLGVDTADATCESVANVP